ncbi:MAG TPA: hypothetical protein P5160_03960 [Candidatus Omnitrophota bacterium]|nr:hypothetical protein [Candidatus Omnitrophota bacterium]
MKKEIFGHTFHIPVMGTGFTIDSPLKVAKYGISSVISLVDDTLMEQMRKFYAEKFGEPYIPIEKGDPDRRARRVTEYLNLLDKLVKKQFEELRNSAFEIESEIHKYFELLPDTSPLKKVYTHMMALPEGTKKTEMQNELRKNMQPGSIDVNIMTKLDKPALDEHGRPAFNEFSEALANLRGYAQSSLKSAIVFSAGLNQRLYSYIENFKDFYADASGDIKKRIVLKVSDFRSSLIQGKIFAKKGLWVSEFRVESGLNCGGHAFSSGGYLMGPILEEFKTKRTELYSQLKDLYDAALQAKNIPAPKVAPTVSVTAQGGIGTYEEDSFLRRHYDLDSTGWGTPFLLCPEATNVDESTLQKLVDADEDDLYMSDSSPLGIPFNNLRNSSSEEDKRGRIRSGKPGAPCVKGTLAMNDEFGTLLCPASITYQTKKIDQLKKLNLPDEEFKRQYALITAKACICHQLGNGVLQKNGIIPNDSQPVSVCPGPNLAYFSKVVSLKEMIDHIYGRISVLNDKPRPNLFLKELVLNIEHLAHYVQDIVPQMDAKQKKYAEQFCQNLFDGIDYYQTLFSETVGSAKIFGDSAKESLDDLRQHLQSFMSQHQLVLTTA